MRNPTLFGIVLGVVAAAVALAQTPAGRQAVSALGRLEPEHGVIRLSVPSMPDATTWAVLDTLHVDEGDDVRKGQLLGETVAARVVRARVAEARATLELSLRGSEATRSRARAVCVRADVTRRIAERRKRLLAEGVTGEEEADNAAGEAEAQAASCTAADTEIRVADARATAARRALERVEAELERTSIRAPIDGRVLDVLARPGERVGNEGVLEFGRVDRMYAIAEVYETDIRRVRKGQRASVASAALESTLSGVVTLIRHKVQKQDEIGTDPAARKDARIIEVEILLDDPTPAAGLTHLQVDVVIHTD